MEGIIYKKNANVVKIRKSHHNAFCGLVSYPKYDKSCPTQILSTATKKMARTDLSNVITYKCCPIFKLPRTRRLHNCN
jgi:hypothetical protein